MKVKTIECKNGSVRFIDQTKLPAKFEYAHTKDLGVLWKAIRELKVRGAPALAAAAALGVVLGMRGCRAKDFRRFKKDLNRVCTYIGSSRPTAVNLFWGLERMKAIALKNKAKPVERIKKLLLEEAQRIIEKDRITCRQIGASGARLIRDNDTLMTVCNAGMLATIDYGTALGVFYAAKERGKKFRVYSCETRPLLQGSRLTAWELRQNKIDATLICDNTVASLMRQGKINMVITGADRIAANGDSANKIGTLTVAILAKYHHIPFYIAAPSSTFDLKIKSGRDIPIEERNPEEVRCIMLKKRAAPKAAKVYNPAFDVTAHELVTGFITDKGIIRPPYRENIKKHIRG